MIDLERQLARYGSMHEHAQRSIDAVEVTQDVRNLEPLQHVDGRNRRWIRPSLAAAGGIAAVVALALIPILVFGGEEPTPSDAPVPTTTPEAPTTIAPTTTLESEGGVVLFETSLGTLTWSSVQGEESELPGANIASDLQGGYFAKTPERLWTSSNGMDWAVQDLSRLRGDEVTFSGMLNGWAIVSRWLGETSITRLTGSDWTSTDIPLTAPTRIEGLLSRESPSLPIESEGSVIVLYTISGVIPWDEIYGVFEDTCVEGGTCQSGPAELWEEGRTTFELVHPETNEPFAELEPVVTNNGIELVDTETGNVVHRISTPNPTGLR